MALASTSRVQLAYVPETVFGETPNVGNAKSLRYTGEGLNYNLNKESSNEINAFRGVSSMVPTSAEASGNINAELAFGEYDDLLAATLQGAWEPYGTGGKSAALDVTFTATELTAGTATAGNDAWTKLKPGQWFTVSGTGTANDGKLFRVSSTVAPTDSVITLDPATPAVPGTSATTVVANARLSNGVLQRSFSIEKHSSDTGEFFLYRGMTPSSFNVNIATASISTLEFSFMGRDATAGNATMLPGTLQPSIDSPVMSGVSGTSCALWYGGAPLSGTFVNSIRLAYDNSLRMQNAICSLGAVGIGSGTIQVTVDIEVYFAAGRAFYDEFLGNVNKEVAFTAFDTEGNGYIFTLPKANVSSYQVTAGGRDSDLMATISLTGLMELGNARPEIQGKVLLIDRVGEVLV